MDRIVRAEKSPLAPLGPFLAFVPALLAAWLALSPAALAQQRASITSAIGGAIYYSPDGWVAVGGVTLTQGDTQITADRMVYDPDAGQAVFSGNVRVRGRGAEVEGAHFVYDLEEGVGRVTEAVAAFEVEGFSSPVYLLGEVLQLAEGYSFVENARLTTCLPLSNPGYYLASRRIDVFPGDRMVIRNVRFVESGITLFYWPYLSIPLREDALRRVRLPEIGHNADDGWYVKTRWAYDGPGDGYGEVALDWFQHKGVGTGVHHTYRSGPDGEGSVTAYRLANRASQHDDLTLAWEERVSLGSSLDATWRSTYLTRRGIAGGEQRESRYSLALDGRIAGSSASAEWAAKRLWGDESLATDRVRFTQAGTLSGWRWRAQVDTFFLRPAGQEPGLSYNLSLRRSQGPFTLNVDVERRMHSRYFSESPGLPSWRLRSSLPSLRLAVDLAEALSPRLPVDLELGWARLAEASRVGSAYPLTEADRSSVALRLQPGSIRLGRLGDLYYRAGIEYQRYSGWKERLILTANHQYRLPIGRSLSLYAGYSYEEAFGDASPFTFDQVTGYEQVTGRLQYSFTRGSAFLSTGYDFRSRSLSDLVGQVSYRPVGGGLLAVQGGYSLQESRPTYVAANVSLSPSERLSVDVSARYNFASSMLDSLSAGLSAAFAGWRLDYEAFFDLEEEVGVSSDVAVVRDLGCREIGLRYSSDARSIWLEYRITAMPGSGIRVGAAQDRFMIDPDSLSALF